MSDNVAILLPARNGAAHLAEQLASIAAQEHQDWQLWVGDDGSTDATREIVRDFAGTVAQPVHLLDGPCRGVAANALSLLRHEDLPEAAMVAFCDQDDVWYPHHLSRAMERLAPGTGAALYCSRTDVGPCPGSVLGQSPLWRCPPGFSNALIQSIAGANTMVLNPAAARLAREAASGPLPAFHDWWLYAVMAGAGAQIVFDPQPSLLYRQHGDNQLGRNRGLAARYARLGTIWRGEYHHWVTRNTRALMYARDLLTPQNRKILQDFVALRRRRGVRVLSGWHRLGLHRQSKVETLLMAGAAALGRI